MSGNTEIILENLKQIYLLSPLLNYQRKICRIPTATIYTFSLMRGVMDECTLLKNYDILFDTCLICPLIAKNDAYI